MLDVDGDGTIEYDEFMDTVKASLASEKGEVGGMSPDTRVAMDELAAYLSTAVVRKYNLICLDPYKYHNLT